MGKSKKILIVEDQTPDLVGPYMLIMSLGFNVTLSFNGEQALNELKRSLFDYVILDWNMPVLSGAEVLEKIESDSSFKKLERPMKIILHSGEALHFEDFLDSKNFRIVDIWEKPLTAAEIAQKIKALSSQGRRAA